MDDSKTLHGPEGAGQADIAWPHESWNHRSTPQVTATVPELFAAAVHSNPDALALVDGTRRLTYDELSVKVAQLARHLRAGGVVAEDVVAIAMPRSAEMVIGVLASMVAGGAFVPVDPEWPEARRETVVADASAKVVLVSAEQQASLSAEQILVSLDDWRFGGLDPWLPDVPIAGGQLAYVIFTSGSTGVPKGAMIRHEAICERLMWQRDHVLLFGPGDASLFKAPLAFDISVNEILLPLVSGGYVVVAAPDGEKDPDYLLDVIAAERVTYLYLVSSMLDALLALDLNRSEQAESSLASVRHVWCGGEVLTPDLFDRFRRQLSTTLYHGYGPAEATIGVSHVIYRDRAERISTSIGRPNPHTQLYVLDDRLEPVPVGTGGELYAAGFLLGRGYVGKPGLTAASFVANAFDSDGSRMYRTGDLARWNPDGSLEFLGRADNQVKIGGRRVELEEIEVSLARHPDVRQAVVTAHGRGSGPSLIGYLTPMPGARLEPDAVREWCLSQLPDYMVPSVLLVLDSFPLNTNGKVDRAALPEPADVERDDVVAPETSHESLLCEAFATMLGVSEVGVDDDFFALGGDSIVAVGLVRSLRAAGIVVRVKDLTAYRTPRRLAAVVGPGSGQTAGRARPADPTDRPLVVLDDDDAAELSSALPDLRAVLPLTAVQSGIYFHSVANGTDDTYIVQQVVDVIGALDPARLARATHAVVERHEALAAGFHTAPSGRLVSTIGTPRAPGFRTLEHIGRPDAETAAFVASAAQEDRDEGFDLTRPPLMRYTLIDLGDDRHCLVQTVHHLVADGWSVAVIWDDIMAAYRGETPAAPAPQFGDFLRWWVHQRDAAGDVAAWSRYLAGADAPTLVTDVVPAGAAVGFGRRHRVLDPDRRRALRDYARTRAVTEAAVLTVAWGITLGCVMTRTDVVFGSTTAGRGEDVGGIDRIVGMVVNTVPTRVQWYPEDTVDEIVQRFVVAEATVLDHQHVPLLDLHSGTGLSELFDTLFSIQNLKRPDSAEEPRLGPIRYVETPHYRLSVLVNLHESVAVEVTNDRTAVGDEVADRIVDLYLRAVSLIVGSPGVPDAPPRGAGPLEPVQADPAGPVRAPVDRGVRAHLPSPPPQTSGLVPIAVAHAGLPGFESFTQSSMFTTPAGLDAAALERVLSRVVTHHPALGGRLLRDTASGTWRFGVDDPVDMDVASRISTDTVSDARGSDSWRHRVARAAAEMSRSLDLEGGVLWRARWFTGHAEPEGRLLLVVHHLVVDGVSWRIIGDDLAQAWQIETGVSTASLLSVGTSLSAWSAALASRAHDADVVAQIDHWSGVLGGEDPLLGSRRTDPGLDTYGGSGEVRMSVPADVTRAVLSELPRALAVEINDVLLGTLAVAVGAWRARRGVSCRRVLVGLEGHGREEGVVDGADLTSTVGWFTSWYPVALDTEDVDPVEAITDPAASARAVLRVGDSLRRVPDRGVGYGLLRYLNPSTAGALASAAAPQIGFNYLGQFGSVGAGGTTPWQVAPERPGIDWYAPDVLRSPAAIDVNVAAVPGGTGLVLEGGFRFAAGVLDEVDVRELVELWQEALGTLGRLRQTVGAGRRFADLTLLREEDRRRIDGWSSGTALPVADTTVDALVREQVRRTPDAVAVVADDGVELTYRQFDARVDALAHVLVERGVGVGDRVAVLLPRSADLVVALVAVLRAGAAYVPIDPGHPAERVRAVLADATPVVVVTEQDAVGPHRAVFDECATEVVELDREPVRGLMGAGASTSPVLTRPLTAADPMYVIFTSGTTGRPKGVELSHGAVVNRLYWARDDYDVGPSDRILQKTPNTFDVSVWEFFLPLIVGARLVVAAPDGHKDPDHIAAVIERQRVTVVHFVPSMLQAFLGSRPDPAQLASVRCVFFSGEALPAAAAVEAVQTFGDAGLHNLYGPTEAAVDVTSHAVVAEELGQAVSVPIGRPVANTVVRVLDGWLRPVPVGVTGELYLGGVQLADGYVGQQGLTAQRFVADPFSGTGERLYRTGDLVRWNESGCLDYLGRSDGQVKVRGFRIELDEIRSVLERHGSVSGAAVVARDHPAGGLLLAAYITAADSSCDESELFDTLRGHLAGRLPEYMIPAVFSRIDALPVTANGKLDGRALPAPDLATGAAGGRSAGTDAERTLVELFRRVLHLDDGVALSAEDDFFRLGGDSLSSIALVRQARRRGMDFTIRDVFTMRTPARLAAVPSPDARATAPDGAPSQDAGSPVAVTPTVNQHRLRLSGLPLDGHLVTEVADVDAGADADRLHDAVAALLEEVDWLRQRVSPRHRRLWTTEILPMTGDLVAQSSSIHDRSTMTADEAFRDLRAQIVDGVDITRGQGVHAAIVTSSQGRHLMVAAHGLAADRATVHRIVARLAARVNGSSAEPGTAVASIVDVAAALDAAAQSAAGEAARVEWADQLSGVPPFPDEPEDRREVFSARVGSSAESSDSWSEAVESAFIAAFTDWAGAEFPVDVECDLRMHLEALHPDPACLPGSLTAVYPRSAGRDASVPIAQWHDLVRYQSKRGSRTFRGVPNAGALLVRLAGRPVDPAVLEGFEPLYAVVARFTVTEHGTDLSVLGPVGAETLLQRWVDSLSS
ncbi:amino acid adenylation domain-containing protein [Pseudonocardia sp. TMWB2A]|uniref:amino acid adenylation domain-containing protein n=1 Tax=Pseudonocardia sp. TMWB2A TaxID=687430 RepID=UPI00307D684D